MININPARIRPQHRVPTQSDKQPSAKTQTYLAPIAGYVSGQPIAGQQEQTAYVLENFWPTERGISPRGGTDLRCTIAGAVESLFEYRAGTQHVFFAADSNNIYEFSVATEGGGALAATVTGQTSADYSTLVTQTDGGSFLLAVNGFDYAQIYDGTTWQQLTDTSSPFAITGVATDTLTHVWSHRNRVFFVQKATMNAWYLGVNSVAGAATKLPLSGVFEKGGSLLFGGTWSSDSGSGMDDRCVFVTDQGEVAVYAGADPSTASDWQLEGVYDIGEPIGKNAVMKVGGDFIIATRAGLIPLSAAVVKDPSQTKLDALSRNIELDWFREVGLTGAQLQWKVVKWDKGNAAIVVPPQTAAFDDFCWVMNLNTGAWAKFTGWNIGGIAVLGGDIYYGDPDGNIFLADTGGKDNGKPFECRLCMRFDMLDHSAAHKTAHAMRTTWRYVSPFNARYSVAKNYKTSFLPPVNAIIDGEQDLPFWDIARWDQDFWASSGETNQIVSDWRSVAAQGVSIAPQIQITSAQGAKLDCELVTIDLMYSTGGVLV